MLSDFPTYSFQHVAFPLIISFDCLLRDLCFFPYVSHCIGCFVVIFAFLVFLFFYFFFFFFFVYVFFFFFFFFVCVAPHSPLSSPLPSLSEPQSATSFYSQQTAGNTVSSMQPQEICFSSFLPENRIPLLTRPRSISPLSSSSSCLVVESLLLSDAISLRIKGLHERRGNTLCSLSWIQETA